MDRYKFLLWLKSITHFAKVSILYLKTNILPKTNRSSFYCFCRSLGYFVGLWNMPSLTTPPRTLTRSSKIFLPVAAFHNNSRASFPGLMDNMTENSHNALVTTASAMTVMSRSCAQSLKMRYNGTLLGTLNHHAVMNKYKFLLQKHRRLIVLAFWYSLCSRDFQIRSRDL